ncbi:hypothetical protein NUI41_003512 [Salmonella enterica subsp. enterica serovar Newport]|nr:hypothetical protein [Salmonella enterica]EJP4069111.1 hypothetical protein [Salmonella enterica subsp. enterica serovar Newport]
MKKTLIALAVAASAVVSGSAMAWTANGTGGTSVDLGGTLTPVEKITPWEVQIGAGTPPALDAPIQKNQQNVDITTPATIPVLGIRIANASTFKGQPGISPNIDYKNAINTSNFSANKATLTLVVNNEQGQKIGTLSTKLSAMGRLSRTGVDAANMTTFASTPMHAFFGGVPVSAAGINDSNLSLVDVLFPGAMANFSGQSERYTGKGFASVSTTSATYSAAYGAGIVKGEKIQIKLDTPAAADAITWKASLPVSVSYQ